MATNRNTDGATPASSLLQGCDVFAPSQTCADCEVVALLMEHEMMLRLLPLAMGHLPDAPGLCLN